MKLPLSWIFSRYLSPLRELSYPPGSLGYASVHFPYTNLDTLRGCNIQNQNKKRVPYVFCNMITANYSVMAYFWNITRNNSVFAAISVRDLAMEIMYRGVSVWSENYLRKCLRHRTRSDVEMTRSSFKNSWREVVVWALYPRRKPLWVWPSFQRDTVEGDEAKRRFSWMWHEQLRVMVNGTKRNYDFKFETYVNWVSHYVSQNNHIFRNVWKKSHGSKQHATAKYDFCPNLFPSRFLPSFAQLFSQHFCPIV